MSEPSCGNCYWRVEVSVGDGRKIEGWNAKRKARCFWWEPLRFGLLDEPCEHWRQLTDEDRAFRRWLLSLSQAEWEDQERRKLEVLR
ncbi:MAG: hypothetical protein ABIH03_01050 [Pseudomonadota bacterium]